MKVCHLTTVHPAKDTRIFHKECATLAKAGHEVVLLVANGPNETDQGVVIVGVPAFTQSRLKRILRTPGKVYQEALKQDADVYHFHDPEFLPYALRLKRKGKIVVYDVHEDVPRQILAKYWIPGPVRKLTSWLFERYENYVASRLSGVVTATPFIRDRFLKLNPRTVDVNNYPIVDQFDPPAKGVVKSRSVAYIGGITEVRGIRELVQALAGTDIRLKLAGKFSPPELQQELEQEAGWKNVDYLGFLDRQQVAQLLAEVQAGMVTLHPIINYLDALPVKMFEYMAAGIPVVASNISYWEQILKEAEAGIVADPLDPASVREAMEVLLADVPKAEKMGKAGRIAIETTFNWGNEGQKLKGFYNKFR
ncbi:MAG: glycosyltransferase family 4 protein [Salibacteraceae bacterium]